MKTLAIIALALLGLLSRSRGASVVVQWSTGLSLLTRGETSELSAGSAAAGDGALLQLGYFSQATPVAPFAGTWTVLTTGSIGDQGDLADGYFAINTILVEGTFVAPAVGTPLGVRFFDGTSVVGSAYYNTAVNTNGTGLWHAFGDPAPVISLVLSKSATRFEDGPEAWTTSIPVPESSVVLLGGVGVGAGLLRCRMRRRQSGSWHGAGTTRGHPGDSA